jgi:hypothetical protein
MGDITPLIAIMKIMLIAIIILAIYSIYSLFFIDRKTIKCTEKPKITYEFKAKGQKIDTVWVYKFK